MHYCPLVEVIINPPEVSSALGTGRTDSDTVAQLAALTIAAVARKNSTSKLNKSRF